MDGIHDMGGMHGFGAIEIDDGDEPFEHTWQARVFASNLALSMHTGNVDRFRFLIESLSPREYLRASYYERWFAAILKNAEEHGFLSAEQIANIRSGIPPATTAIDVDALPADAVGIMLNAPAPGTRDLSGVPRFVPGDHVRARNQHIAGHTRMPRYVRGHRGEVLKDNGGQLFPDSHASTGDRELQRLYTVSFNAKDLWGDNANANDVVCLDLWETYLDVL